MSMRFMEAMLAEMKEMNQSILGLKESKNPQVSEEDIISLDPHLELDEEEEECDKREWRNERRRASSQSLHEGYSSVPPGSHSVPQGSRSHSRTENQEDYSGKKSRSEPSKTDHMQSRRSLDHAVSHSGPASYEPMDTEEYTEEEEGDNTIETTFKGAIEAVYGLLPSLPSPESSSACKLNPLSHMPGDIEREDSSKFSYFPESPLIKECVSQIHQLWWDVPLHEADLSSHKTMPSNTKCRGVDIKHLPLLGYKDKYYRDPKANIPVDAPEMGQQWETNIGPYPKTVSVDYKGVVALEKTLRRVVATVSAVDVLVASMRRQAAHMAQLQDSEKSEA